MHLELRYVTRFLYPSPVWDSHNVLRARPVSDEYQQLSSYSVEITPTARVFTYVDNWGTEVNSFSIVDAHTELIVEANAVVDTVARPQPELSVEAAAFADDAFREQHWVFLQPSRHVRWTDEIRDTTSAIGSEQNDAIGRIGTIQRHVSERLAYQPGATVVGTAVEEVWNQASGVCQDFSHLTIAMLRSVGIPARYVSGYLYAADPSAHDLDDDGEIVVQTHAWVEAAIPGWGWWGIDPTNATVVGERHVVIGHGRDYEDVMPLRGVYHGDTKAELSVEVTIGTTVVDRTRFPEVTFDQ